MPAPTIYVIAGCNGAGKTTFAKEFLPHEVKCLRFYNADEVARGLSPFDPSAGAIKAGRVLLNEIRESLNRHETFALEKHTQREDLHSHVQGCVFSSATSWNCITSGSPTPSRQSHVCVVVSAWEAIMFQFRISADGLDAASIICSMITCHSRRGGRSGTTVVFPQNVSRLLRPMI